MSVLVGGMYNRVYSVGIDFKQVYIPRITDKILYKQQVISIQT